MEKKKVISTRKATKPVNQKTEHDNTFRLITQQETKFRQNW